MGGAGRPAGPGTRWAAEEPARRGRHCRSAAGPWSRPRTRRRRSGTGDETADGDTQDTTYRRGRGDGRGPPSRRPCERKKLRPRCEGHGSGQGARWDSQEATGSAVGGARSVLGFARGPSSEGRFQEKLPVLSSRSLPRHSPVLSRSCVSWAWQGLRSGGVLRCEDLRRFPLHFTPSSGRTSRRDPWFPVSVSSRETFGKTLSR